MSLRNFTSSAQLSKAHCTLIQEQNSYAGVTNKLLAQKARKICVAYDGMEKFFPADKIIMTGNPVRQNLTKDMPSKEEALGSFHSYLFGNILTITWSDIALLGGLA